MVWKTDLDELYYEQFRKIYSYYDFDYGFEKFKDITFIKDVKKKKGEVLLDNYSKAKYIYFICKGILRTYYLGENGEIYTKKSLYENYFSASKSFTSSKEDSYLNIEALEDCTLIFIDFDKV